MRATQFAELHYWSANSSPWDCLIEYRPRWAARQLRDRPHRIITQIALACGFSTSQCFATCLRRRFHCEPRE
jgi:AraC-like DNA-binding protein